MKIKLDLRFLIAIFFVLDTVLFFLILHLMINIHDQKIVSVGAVQKSYSLPVLSPDIVEKLDVSSHAFIIYDSESRSIIAGKNEKLRFAPASSAKIMSAIIVLENYDLGKILVATDVASVEGSKMWLEEGERITVENLIYGMMLPSGNDAAYVLADAYKGGKEAFVLKMNEKAKTLEMLNTRFVDPAGFDDFNYTTAFDLARLAAYSVKNPKLLNIVSTKSKVVTDESGKKIHELHNLNELLGVDGINGIKTGFTDEAGGVLVTSLEFDNRNYIVVVLSSTDRFLDTQNIIHEGLKKLRILTY